MMRTLAIALMVIMLATGATATALYSPGLNTIDLQITIPGGGFVGGFDILPNGNYLVNDGHAIREISLNGTVDKALYTFAASVSGSFARYNSADGKVYFGESSHGDILAFSYTNPDDVAVVTNIANNFDMDFRQGQPYVVASDGGWSNSFIYLLNGSANDLIATCDGPSGPLAFTSAGDLVYIPASYDISTEILTWSNSVIEGAIGPESIARADADAVATIESAYGSALNSTGGVMFTNSGLTKIQVFKDGVVSPFASFVEPGGKYPFISLVRENATTGAVCTVVTYTDANDTVQTVISSMAIPEPSSMLALCSMIGLVGSAKLLRRRSK